MSVKPAHGSVPSVIVSVEGAHDIVIVRLDVVEVLGDGGVGMMSHRDAGGCRDGLFLQFRTAILEPDLHLSAAQLQVTWEVGEWLAGTVSTKNLSVPLMSTHEILMSTHEMVS